MAFTLSSKITENDIAAIAPGSYLTPVKRTVFLSLVFFVFVGDTRGAEEKFSQTVSSTDFAALGLSKLSPEELSRLDAKVEAYKSGALAGARRAADAALAAKQAAEAEAARSEVEARAAKEAKAAAETARRAEQTSVVRNEHKPAPERVAIESTLPGKFRGWSGREIFVLANGQRWQVANYESYYSPVAENVRVQITRATMGGYWLKFPDLDARVRVLPLDEK